MRIFIAEADQEVRLALQMLLLQEADICVIGIAEQTKGLVDRIVTAEPDLLLLGWNLPGTSIPDLFADLQELEGRPKIIVLSVRPEDESVVMAAGADAFIIKNSPPDTLVSTIHSLNIKPKDGAPVRDEDK